MIREVIRVEDYEDPDGRDNSHKLVEEGIVEAWQRRWDRSQKGRHTYTFFLNVSSRLRARYSWQHITSHRWSRAMGRSRRDCTGWDWPRTLDVAALWGSLRLQNTSSVSAQSITASETGFRNVHL